jgi:uncharacterized membrane protein
MKERWVLLIGILFLAVELAFLIIWVVVNSSFAAKILSMVTANHVGGRLAFIAVGLENGLSSNLIIPIIVIYNTTYLLLMYSMFVFFSGRVKKIRFIRNYLESLKNKAAGKKSLIKKWNWFGLSLFVWVPLPWTGAVIGSYIAHLEGYNTRETLSIVIPSMWIGIVSWTLWFDELYEFIDRFGRGRTIFLTVFLLIIPILYVLLEGLRKNK